MKIFLLLDMNNLWNACCEQYGKRARVNIERIVAKAKGRKTDDVVGAAFVAIKPDKNQDNLNRKLEELGFAVYTIPVDEGGTIDFSSHMISVLEPMLDSVDTVVLASGDPTLLPVIEMVNQCNKNSQIIAFCNGLNSVIAKEADDIKLLDKRDIIIQ